MKPREGNGRIFPYTAWAWHFSRRMKKRYRFVVFLILGFGVLALTFRLWLPLPGNFLVIDNPPQKTDCLVVLRGDDYYRIPKAVELLKAGYSNEVVLSLLPKEPYLAYADILHILYELGSIAQKDLVLKYFAYFGKNPEGIHFTDRPATSTFEEALATKDWIKQKGFQSLTLVTNPYHTRRAGLIFGHVFKETGIKIYSVTAPNPFDDPSHWWRKERDVKQVALEYLSLFHNVIYHFLLNKNHSSFDTA